MIEIQLPASKSIYNRVAILNAQNNFVSTLIVNNLSLDSSILEEQLDNLRSGAYQVNIGEAGTSMRFMTAMLACTEGNFELTGIGRILERPIAPLVNCLRSLGAEIYYAEKDDFLPIYIKGKKISGGEIVIDGSISSQFISALMLVAPQFQNGLTIRISNEVVSFPYIKMTAQLLQNFGVPVELSKSSVSVPNHNLTLPFIYFVESDWSAAAFWYEILILHPTIQQIKLKNLTFSGLQGDEQVAKIFQELGVETIVQQNDIVIRKKEAFFPEYFEIDLMDVPDLAPALVVTLALLKIKSEIRGLITLNKKESERIHVLKAELEKCGVIVETTNDSIRLLDFLEENPSQVLIDVHNDHRIEMAFAPLLFLGSGNGIEDAKSVAKSYPNFWEEFNKILNNTQWED